MPDDPQGDDAEESAIHDWVTRAGAPARDVASAELTPPPQGLPPRIGRYAIVRKLGEGGMGVVYAARDERLGRTIALKTMASLTQDETARQRFWREARAAASVNHPNVCQIYEIGEDEGRLFIAMEFLEGQSLALRLRGGAMNVAETVPIGLGLLGALEAMHAAGVVHRDLKPSNVFLTAHGVKLLDFGLARPREALSSPEGDLTRTGMMVGTPRYMAPEQVTGDEVDARCDLFAAGTILFEMLAGRPAFPGRNVVDVLHATLHEQPPALTGSPAVAALDRVIRKALAKRAAERPASAEAMAADLRAAASAAGGETPALARTLTRLVVLPFRVLRPDPETDFLSFSLPDAIATSLSGVGSLVVRSSAVAARFAGDAPDLKAISAEADVDRVVMGSLLRAGDRLRATAQLVEAPGGTLLASHAVQSSLGDLFGLQDDIAQRVVEALALPLSVGDTTPTPRPAAPHDARAYELYLRANELARRLDGAPAARDLYQRSLELDPGFAPAWARLGRCHRVIGKFIGDGPGSDARVEQALRRALELNPRLSIAHKYYAQFEADQGHATEALVRLLREAGRHGNDPELFAGLVHVLRYCGLFEQAIVAHEEARRLDPNVPTSYEQTLLVAGDIERLLAVTQRLVGSGDEGIRVIALGMAGRRDEARRELLHMGEGQNVTAFRPWKEYLLAWLDRRVADMADTRTFLGDLKIMDDPEAIFQEGWALCDVGEYERGLPHLQRAVAKGYFVAPTLETRPQFDGLRGDPRFQKLLEEAKAGRQRALAVFNEEDGERLCGCCAP